MTYNQFSEKFAVVGGFDADSVLEFLLMVAIEDNLFLDITDTDAVIGVVRNNGKAIQALRFQIAKKQAYVIISPINTFTEARTSGVSENAVSPYLEYMVKYVAGLCSKDGEFLLSTTEVLKNKFEILLAIRHLKNNVA